MQNLLKSLHRHIPSTSPSWLSQLHDQLELSHHCPLIFRPLLLSISCSVCCLELLPCTRLSQQYGERARSKVCSTQYSPQTMNSIPCFVHLLIRILPRNLLQQYINVSFFTDIMTMIDPRAERHIDHQNASHAHPQGRITTV